MAIDESKLPTAGERVRFRRKGGTLYETGRVEYQWWACDEVAIAIRTDDGGTLNLLPVLGDEVERVHPCRPGEAR